MLRSGQPLNTQWRTVNKQGAQGTFGAREMISARDAIENRRPRMLLGGAPGWNWGNPIELPDPESGPMPGFAKGTVIHIQGTNSIVTTGMTDLGSNTNVQSQAGLWVSTQAVPAQASDSNSWNVPQSPLPVPDDYDSPSNFWVPVAGGNSGPGFTGEWNPTIAYAACSIVWVPNTTVYNGVTVLAGFYGALQAVPAKPAGNQIPQFPPPASNVYWVCMGFTPQAVNQNCGAGFSGYVIATTPITISST